MTMSQEAVGKTYNFWTVLSEADHPFCLCRCSCGVEKLVNVYNVESGASKSCGCHKHRVMLKRNTTHGMTETRAYRAWCSMWTRCTNKKQKTFAAYESRLPPERWKSFELFFEDMGDCPEGKTIERVDNRLPYGPSNCRWATQDEQAANKRNTTLVRIDGNVMSLKKACAYLNVGYTTVIARMKRLGWSVQEALGSPVEVIKIRENYNVL